MKQKKSNFMRIIVILICITILFFSAFQIVKVKINDKKEAEKFEILRERVSEEKNTDNDNKQDGNFVAEVVPTTKNKDERNPYKEIYQTNNDLVGWISIADTPIDYPVMSTPGNPNYYLRRNFDKEYSLSGTPFIGDGLSPESKSFIIYAHNMKNKTMFGTLENYKDIDYKNNHKYIVFNTLNENRVYEVIGAFHTEIDEDNPNLFKYYNYCGNLEREQMEEFIHKISDISIYGKLRDITYEDQIMMLSTCSYFADEGRFIVVAKRIQN